MKEEAVDAIATGMDAIVTGMDAGESMEQISTQSLPLKEANSLQLHLGLLSSRANWKMVNSLHKASSSGFVTEAAPVR